MLPAGVRIFLCTEPQDMRRSFDALALVTRELLHEDPQSGALFVFVGKRPTRAKVLWWDRNGYCLLYSGFTAPCSGCRRRRPARLPRSGSTGPCSRSCSRVSIARRDATIE